jgi:phosphate transport system substrate-binding protein
MKLIHLPLVAAFALAGLQANAAVDANLPTYKKTTDNVSGNLSSVGSDTLANLMTFWSEEFKRLYPSVNMQIQAAGSSTAPPALTQGTSNFGPMSREMKDKEIAEFESKYGYKPTAVPVAVDALAVFVHQDNPAKGLSIEAIDAIFSSTRKCGKDASIDTWGQTGLKGKYASKGVTLYGRNSVSGTYGYFKDNALCKGDFKTSVKEQPGSAAVVQAVATNPYAIGYSGIGYTVSGAKPLALKGVGKDQFIKATPANALNGTYPLSRYLYVYVNKKPGQPLAAAEREFLKMALSKQGQQIVEKDGYVPLPAKTVRKIEKDLGL